MVLVDGELTLYMERGGKTLLAWPTDPDSAPADDPRLQAAAQALSTAARAGSSARSRWSGSTASRP